MTKLWQDAEIPAKLYFKILDSNDFTLLGEGTNEEREKAWSKIVDEDFEITNNQKVKSYLDKRCKIEALKLHIQAIKDQIYVLVYMPLTDKMKSECSENLKILGCKYDIEKDIVDECHRIMKSNIGILKNQLNMLEDTVIKKSEGIKKSFEADLVAIENVLMRPLHTDVTLRYFREASKSAKSKSEANQKLSKKNGK